MSLITPIPNGPFYSNPSNYIDSPQGFLVVGSGLVVDPTGTILSASSAGGTVTQITAGTGLSGGTITTTGTIGLIPATNISLGGIKVGANLLIAPDGTLSALPPGTGTINSVLAGSGLSGGGVGPSVTLNLSVASTTQFGGVSISPTGGIAVSSGVISLEPATIAAPGGIQLATASEVITGIDPSKAVTPATLAAKVATLSAPGIVQLSDSVATDDSTKAATQTAVKLAYDTATAASLVANDALPLAGGTMTGVITFDPAQTFPGVSFPKATTTSLGVVQIGSGLNVTTGGVISTVNNGTVTSITPGTGLGAPATGNTITTSGTIQLLPPTLDGTKIGGVKRGTNITIAVDGTISATDLIKTNNPYSFNGYLWPIPNPPPALACPGTNGQVLTILDNVTGELGWVTPSGTLEEVIAGTGITVVSPPTTATVSLTPVPSILPGTYGTTAQIPTFAVDAYGRITSSGVAEPFSPFFTTTPATPPLLQLDFALNRTNWEVTLQGNTTISNPLNAVSGQTGSILIRQNPLTPYAVTWGTSWKFENFSPYTANAALSSVDFLTFTVVSADYIVVTGTIRDVG
jgi:hypothetical protein